MRTIKGFFAALILVALILPGFSGCKRDEKHVREIFALDTYITFTVYGKEEVANEAIDAAIERLNEIEDHMSISIEDNDIDRINEDAGIKPVKVNDDTFYVIKRGLYYSELTDGIFDITIYPLVELWDIKAENPRVPDEDEILKALELVDYKKVRLNEENKTVYLEGEGMKIDLGGIAKGYAADEVETIFQDHGIKHAIINLGGNIKVIGSKPDKSDWRIALRDPRGDVNDTIAIVKAKDKTVVSSGDYERYMVKIFEESGKRYHHIFDPNTGYPAESGLMGTAIVSSSSIDADALSTILFILGVDEGLKLIEQIDQTDGIAISVDKKFYMTDGVKEYISVTDDEYRIAG